MPKAYSYLRFSTPDQAQGDSFRRQHRAAVQYALEKGLDLDEDLTFHDLGVSAYRGANAAAGRLGDFLEAVRAGLVPRGSHLLVESLDRISRQSARRALRVLEDIVEEGITVVTLTDRREYTTESLDSDPTSLIMSILVFIRANEESEMKARRLRAAWQHKRADAEERPLTASCPAWLELDKDAGAFRILPEPAETVRSIYRAFLAGQGVSQIVKDLNSRGIPTIGRGRQWHSSYVWMLLGNPAVIGTFTPHIVRHEEGRRIREPQDPIPNYYPAIVRDTDFAAVQALRKTRSPGRGRNAGRIRNIFAGILRCGRCGGAATSTTNSRGRRYWVCRAAKTGMGCIYDSVPYHDAEVLFLGRVDEILQRVPSGPSQALEAKLQEANHRIWGLEEEVENLTSEIALRPTISLREALAHRDEALRNARAEHGRILEEIRIARGPLVQHRVADLAEALHRKTLDYPEVNARMRQVFSEVVIDFEAEELVLKWRHGGESRVEYSTSAYGFTTMEE